MNDSPIERYLDDLVSELSSRRPRELRELLAETEGHLRDDAAALGQGGLSEEEAELAAVRRFGPARALAAADRRSTSRPLSAMAGQVLSTGWLLGSVGAVAVGVSGVLAAVIRLLGGARALVDVAPGQQLSAADCARWLSGTTGQTCRQAAVADWANETVAYRIALGVLGVLALVGYRVVRGRLRVALLPGVVTDTIAVTFFVIGGVWTLGLGVDALAVSSGHGSGQWLSAAPVALGGAAFFAVRLVRELPTAMPYAARRG